MAMAAATKTDRIIMVVTENQAMGQAVPWVLLQVATLVVAVAEVKIRVLQVVTRLHQVRRAETAPRATGGLMEGQAPNSDIFSKPQVFICLPTVQTVNREGLVAAAAAVAVAAAMMRVPLDLMMAVVLVAVAEPALAQVPAVRAALGAADPLRFSQSATIPMFAPNSR